MADASVEFLLNNLKILLIYHSHRFKDNRSQIESLERDFRVFKGFLKDSVKARRKDERIKILVRNIRNVVYEVEDIIDAFVTEATVLSSKNYFIRVFRMGNLHGIGRKVEEISKQVMQSTIDFKSVRIADEDDYEKNEVRLPRLKNMVGFVDETVKLINRLTTETEYFDVISLVGMFGSGKTTLAWKIFNDPKIMYEFPIRIWVYISQNFSNRDTLLTILNEVTPLTKELREKDEHELALSVAAHLENKRFLIVMDDVWDTTDWDRLRNALPENNKMGKVLITSRDEKVGRHASLPREPHMMRLFTEDESWELLRFEALGKMDCPFELVGVGRKIARECNGLPLGVVVMGGILAPEFSASHISKARKRWEKVSRRMGGYLNDDQGDRMNNFISLSYDRLPDHLRVCFLYLGMFPKDYEIPVSKLIHMWIGEGFIQQNNDYSLEETAEKYLEDLINRNLVKTEKIKHDGKVKTCRIHDILREFCISEAGNERENLFQEIKYVNRVFVPHLSECRRLSIHSDSLSFLFSKPFGPRVRSFVCFSKDEIILPAEVSYTIPAGFRLLRVLDVKPLRFTRFPSNMYDLVHLRYLVLSICIPVLPSGLTRLWNIQTLIIDTTFRTLEVKADLCKMNQLRHFKTNASTTLAIPSKDNRHGEELQILGTISPESCTALLFYHNCNLKKLGIRGRLALLFEGKIGSFDSLGRLKNLEKLKLINDVFPELPSESRLRVLPQPYLFPSRLRSLTLYATYLSWSNMSILGLVENLEVLKLKDKAFMGDSWEAVDGGFRHLELLHIENTNLVAWTASSHHFPRLRGLVLRYCEELHGIPIGLADIPSFQMLDVFNCRSAAASAREIQEAKIKEQADSGTIFKLSIIPLK